MSDDLGATSGVARLRLRWLKRVGVALSVLFAVWVLLAWAPLWLGMPAWIHRRLLWGWWDYGTAAFPQVRVDGAAVLTGVLCFAGLTVAVQLFGGFVYGAVTERRGARRSWRWHWSGLCVAGVALLFVAGLAGVGLTQNGYGLGMDRERWISSDMAGGIAAIYGRQLQRECRELKLGRAEADERARAWTLYLRGRGQLRVLVDQRDEPVVILVTEHSLKSGELYHEMIRIHESADVKQLKLNPQEHDATLARLIEKGLQGPDSVKE